MASGRPDDGALVFPAADGAAWTKDDWDVFRANAWKTACKHAQLIPAPRPYDLRHSFASLLLAEGRAVHYVAAQLGHSPALTLSTYGHLIAEFADAAAIQAESEIVAAHSRQKEQNASRGVG
jgi:integrase